MKSPTVYVIGAALSVSLLTAWHLVRIPQETIVSYDNLHSRWLSEALRAPLPPDPRRDFDTLRPLIDYTGDIVLVHTFEQESPQDRTDPGWQIAGSLVDLLTHNNDTYLLYGRKNAHHLGGDWQTSLDPEQSFDDYLLVKRSGYENTVISHGNLPIADSSSRLGLKPNESGSGIEILFSTESTRTQIIDVYSF